MPRWMQHVAREMNLSETAFLAPRPERATDSTCAGSRPTSKSTCAGTPRWRARTCCGRRAGSPDADTARFHTRSGLLTARDAGEWIELDFPATPDEAVDPPAGLAEALGARAALCRPQPVRLPRRARRRTAVRGVRPDFAPAARGSRCAASSSRAARRRRASISSRGSSRRASGIDEDPVTGSTHCCLGPFWSRRLGKRSSSRVRRRQRGGILRVTLDGERVRLGGQAVTRAARRVRLTV